MGSWFFNPFTGEFDYFEKDANQTKFDKSGATKYIGVSKRGNATSASGWLIFSFTEDTNTVRDTLDYQGFADGIWDDRATLEYYN